MSGELPHEDPSRAAPGWAAELLGFDLPSAAGSGGDAHALVRDGMARYCWSYDERMAGELEACFLEDAVWEGSVAGKTRIGPIEGRAEIVAWLTGFWPHQHDQRRHMLLNPLVELRSATEATLLSYLLLTSASEGAARIETTGFYRVAFARAGGRWKIKALFGGFDAPFWPGKLEHLSDAARRRHGLR